MFILQAKIHTVLSPTLDSLSARVGQYVVSNQTLTFQGSVKKDSWLISTVASQTGVVANLSTIDALRMSQNVLVWPSAFSGDLNAGTGPVLFVASNNQAGWQQYSCLTALLGRLDSQSTICFSVFASHSSASAAVGPAILATNGKIYANFFFTDKYGTSSNFLARALLQETGTGLEISLDSIASPGFNVMASENPNAIVESIFGTSLVTVIANDQQRPVILRVDLSDKTVSAKMLTTNQNNHCSPLQPAKGCMCSFAVMDVLSVLTPTTKCGQQ